MLQAGEMSNSSSSNSLNLTSGSLHGGKTGLTMPRSRQSSVTSSQENLLDRKSTLTRKNSGIPTFASPPKTADGKEKKDRKRTPIGLWPFFVRDRPFSCLTNISCLISLATRLVRFGKKVVELILLQGTNHFVWKLKKLYF